VDLCVVTEVKATDNDTYGAHTLSQQQSEGSMLPLGGAAAVPVIGDVPLQTADGRVLSKAELVRYESMQASNQYVANNI
jgi:hypothetical protein